jgi:hypothetical protein
MVKKFREEEQKREEAENRIRKLNQLQMVLRDPAILEKQLKKITYSLSYRFFPGCFCWLQKRGIGKKSR